jgi:Ser/Thr protein kinase RdoA (MazF antagonist)
VTDELARHLTQRYGVAVRDLVPLDHDVYRVQGVDWVARRFPAGTDDAVAATADLLRRLAPTRVPAEQLADDEPVSVCGARPVLVTRFVDGRPAPRTPRMCTALGAWLGGLHKQSGDDLPAGGGWHHLVAQGSPADEIAAAAALLARTDGDRAAIGTLRAELGSLDAAADLPHALVHPDLVPENVIRPPEGGMVIVDWSGAGRGPRLWSLAFLLWAAGDLALVDSVMSGYTRHVRLTAEELDRLPDAVRGRPLTLDCWSVANGRLDPAAAVRRLDRRAERAEAVAARVRSRHYE